MFSLMFGKVFVLTIFITPILGVYCPSNLSKKARSSIGIDYVYIPKHYIEVMKDSGRLQVMDSEMSILLHNDT